MVWSRDIMPIHPMVSDVIGTVLDGGLYLLPVGGLPGPLINCYQLRGQKVYLSIYLSVYLYL